MLPNKKVTVLKLIWRHPRFSYCQYNLKALLCVVECIHTDDDYLCSPTCVLKHNINITSAIHFQNITLLRLSRNITTTPGSTLLLYDINMAYYSCVTRWLNFKLFSIKILLFLCEHLYPFKLKFNIISSSDVRT